MDLEFSGLYNRKRGREKVKIPLSTIIAVLRCLPKLETIRVCSFSYEDTEAPPPILPPLLSTELQSLNLSSSSLSTYTWRPILDIIGLFDSITELRLLGITMVHAESPVVVSRPKTRVWSLALWANSDLFDELVDGILSAALMEDVKELELEYYASAKRHTGNLSLLNATIPNLQHLILQVFSTSCILILLNFTHGNFTRRTLEWSHSTVPYNLSSFSELKPLHFIFEVFSCPFHFDAFNILASLSPTSPLSRITIELRHSLSPIFPVTDLYMKLASSQEWRSEVSVLLHRVPNLRRVDIRVREGWCYTVPANVKQAFRDALEVPLSCKVAFSSVDPPDPWA
ncbi:hypothetical protein EUX98_g3113 [Antrodiella citrinella]|uniref:Uncharacterized protein n=1 Tax=Antrodiella citrinella TaxID=2447956 RepID=A0A4S4MXC8_9APHY|nr:hypothetical protein EUX98_g3113 [Antrodiella citrinella]